MEQLTFDLVNVKSQCDRLCWKVKSRALKRRQQRRESSGEGEKLISSEIKCEKNHNFSQCRHDSVQKFLLSIKCTPRCMGVYMSIYGCIRKQ